MVKRNERREIVKKKNKIFLIVLMVLSMIFGIGLITYPAFSNWYMEKTQSMVYTTYKETMEQIDTSAINSAIKAAQRYNAALFDGLQLGEETQLEDYDSLLNLSGTGIMGYVEIPALCVNIPIYHGCMEKELQNGAGHLQGTSLPVGGADTHAVIAAYSGMAGARMFTDLERLEYGDTFFLHVAGKTLTYEVDEIKVTLPSDIEAVRILKGEDLVTLLTCTPYGLNTHRLLVRGCRAQPSEKEAEQGPDITLSKPVPRNSVWKEKYVQEILIGLIASVCVLTLCLSVFLILPSTNERRKRKFRHLR